MTTVSNVKEIVSSFFKLSDTLLFLKKATPPTFFGWLIKLIDSQLRKPAFVVVKNEPCLLRVLGHVGM